MQAIEPILIERTFKAPIHTVWQALTDRDQMEKWYFNLPEFKAEPGFEFEFEGGDDCKTFLHRCKVTEVIPDKKLTYSWRYEGYEGNSFVSFQLIPEGTQTRLLLSHAGLETLPASVPSFARENFVAGWTEIIGSLLKNFVEKQAMAIQ